MLPLPTQFLAAWLAVWLGRVLQRQIDYLTAENRLLREKLGGHKVPLTDGERRRPAVLGRELGRKGLAKVATIARPETILRWYRELVARKHDGSARRGSGRPRKRGRLAELVRKMARGTRAGATRGSAVPCRTLGYTIGRSTI